MGVVQTHEIQQRAVIIEFVYTSFKNLFFARVQQHKLVWWPFFFEMNKKIKSRTHLWGDNEQVEREEKRIFLGDKPGCIESLIPCAFTNLPISANWGAKFSFTVVIVSCMFFCPLQQQQTKAITQKETNYNMEGNDQILP